jgi:hypothetical protein
MGFPARLLSALRRGSDRRAQIDERNLLNPTHLRAERNVGDLLRSHRRMALA